MATVAAQTVTDIEKRLARIEARHEIENLIARYGRACDDRDTQGVADLFTEDGVFGTKNGASDAHGPAEIFELFNTRYHAMGISYHWSHDRLIEFPHEDLSSATGVIFSHIEAVIDGKALLGGARYYDEYRCDDGVWRFRKRELHFLYFTPAEAYADTLTGELRMTGLGQDAPADFPETLDSWKNWTTKQYVAPSDR